MAGLADKMETFEEFHENKFHSHKVIEYKLDFDDDLDMNSLSSAVVSFAKRYTGISGAPIIGDDDLPEDLLGKIGAEGISELISELTHHSISRNIDSSL